ncbi:sigma-70 family RNA polymerase sigma factor [Hymenobacter sp. BT190]|nr:sigma-70 family RNA polymerase sigma factor [Hymenobacter sp. BT190]
MQPATTQPTATGADLREALLADRANSLTQLYRYAFPAVQAFVLRHNGTAAEAKDVFQDAVVILYEKAVAGTLHLTAAPATYLQAVARNQWRQELARRQRRPHTRLNANHLELPADEPEILPAVVPVLDYLERLSDKCRNILLSFYYFRQPLEQIAATHTYRSVRSATVQKFKCLERLRNVARQALR